MRSLGLVSSVRLLMRIILTGGSGFLGGALARGLQDAGHEVALLMRPTSSSRRLAGRSFKIGRYSSDDEIRAFVEQIKPHVIIHTACAYGRQGEGLLELMDVNVRLGLVLLQAMQEAAIDAQAGPPCFINAGSALPPEVSAYALSKYQFAQWGHCAARTGSGRLQFINVELQHMYGPGDDVSKFTTHVLHACHDNEPFLKLTAGTQCRDFIYIDDVVQAYLAILEHLEQLAVGVDVPVGTGVAVSVRDYVEAAHRLCQSQTELQFGALPYRANEPMHCLADLTLMKGLGWAPHYDLRSGLQRMIEQEF